MTPSRLLSVGCTYGAYVVTGVVHDGMDVNTTTYACSTICCDRSYTKLHKVLKENRDAGRHWCQECARDKAKTGRSGLDIGEILACYQVVSVVREGSKKERVYRVKTLCCGDELDRTQANIERSQKDNIQQCERCTKRNIHLRRRKPEYLSDQLADIGLISAATAWPLPASLRVSA